MNFPHVTMNYQKDNSLQEKLPLAGCKPCRVTMNYHLDNSLQAFQLRCILQVASRNNELSKRQLIARALFVILDNSRCCNYLTNPWQP